LVHNLARGYSQQGLGFADLVQEGNLGLMRAVEKYDPALGYRFSTYAVWWIRHALRRALSNQSRTIRLPVHATENRASLRHARLRLERSLGHPPSDEELAAAAGLSTSKLRDLFAVAGAPLSLDGGSDSPGKLSLAECLGDPNAKDPCDTIAQRSAQQWLKQRLAELAPREQEMLKLRFGLGGGEALTLKEVGHEFGVTRERVRQIVSAAIDRLRSAADSDADRVDRPVSESSN
jgi:RNA polymerase primary sigma factor